MLKLIKEDNIKPVPAEEETEVKSEESIEAEANPEIEVEAFNNACQDLVNNLIQAAWDFISQANSVITTINYEFKDETTKKEISELLNSIVDDTTIDIGILHKVFELLNNEKAELLASGEAKAEDILDNSKN